MAQPPKQLVGRGVQINHRSSLSQVLAIGRPQNNTAASGQHTLGILRKLVDDRFLNITESIFSLSLKIGTNRTTQLLFDHMVGVKKW